MDKDKLAWYCLKPHLINLRLFGVYQMDPKSTPRRKYILHQFFMRLCLFLQVLYASLEIVYVYQVRNDIDKVMDSMFLLLSFVSGIFKLTVMWLKGDKIEELLDILKSPLLNQEDPSHKEILSAWVNKARVILRVYNTNVVVTCLLWTVFPLISYLKGYYVDFAIWLPWDCNNPSYFYIVLCYQLIQTTWLGLVESTSDSFQSFLFAQCAIQFSILRLDLQTLVESSKKRAQLENISFDKAFHETFRNCLLHYNEIVTLAVKIEDVIGSTVFCQFVVTGWIFCTTTYRMMSPLSVEFFSMIFYMSCVLFEIYLFCFYGNEVTIESEKLCNAAYNMSWLEVPVKQRRSLIIFMERIKRPIQPMAGIIVPLSVETFLAILRSSYTFYSVLKTTG